MREETTTAMLGLGGFRVRSAEEVDGELVVEMETADPVLACPDCGGIWTESRGRRRVKLRDTPSGGRQLRLVWAKRQRRCVDPDCERASFVEQHQAVGRRRRTTARCRSFIADQVGPSVGPLRGWPKRWGWAGVR